MSWASRRLAEFYAAPSLRRRFANALHAFVWGHTARDIQRARRSRLGFLGLRLCRHLEARDSFLGHENVSDAWGTRPSGLVARLAKDTLEGADEIVMEALLKKLHVHRAMIEIARVRPSDMDLVAYDRPEYAVDVFGGRGAPRKFYGKLFAGLGEQPHLRFGNDKLSFCARHGHLILRGFIARIKTVLRGRVE